MIVSASIRPTASCRDQPNVASAAGFQSMITPRASIAMNASCAPSRIARKSRSLSIAGNFLATSLGGGLPVWPAIASHPCVRLPPDPLAAFPLQPLEQRFYLARQANWVEGLREVGDRT